MNASPAQLHPGNTTIPDNHILSIKAVAARLGVTDRAVRNYLVQKRNPLPHSKPAGKILIHSKDLDAWTRKRKS